MSSLCTAVSLSSAGWLALCTHGRSCSLQDQVQIRSSFFDHAVWLSNGEPHRSLLNLAVQQTKGLGLTWKFLIRLVSYTSHKQMYKVNDDGFEAKPSWSRVYPLFRFFSSITKEFNQSEACFQILCWEHFEHPSACPWALNTAARQERKHQLRTKPRVWIFPTDRAAHEHRVQAQLRMALTKWCILISLLWIFRDFKWHSYFKDYLFALGPAKNNSQKKILRYFKWHSYCGFCWFVLQPA